MLIAGAALWYAFSLPERARPPFAGEGEVPPESAAEERRLYPTDVVLPVGELLVTREREAYTEGGLRLVLPRLGLDTPVMNGTDLAVLARGPGLYEYGQLPDIYNTNTSIAAHRDIYGRELYYAETVTEGDFIYLVYRGKVFCYAYLDTAIVAPDDWSLIRTAGDCRVTLTTCEPRGVSSHRLIITGGLAAVDDYSEDYEFR
jgi:sortase A